MTAKQHANQKGYTLLELSISLTIIALLTTGGLAIIQKKQSSQQQKTSYEHINTIESAIQQFVQKNNYLPCPAVPTTSEKETNFGIASNYNTVTHACTTETGSIPNRTLQLPDHLSYDGWGRKFTYRIATGMGNSQDFSSRTYTGDITITDIIGYNKTASNHEGKNKQAAAYIIISHGANGKGAWGKNTSTITAPTQGLELENTNHTINKRYIQHLPTTSFDDILAFTPYNILHSPKQNLTPFNLKPITCHNAQRIVQDGTPTPGTNDLGTFANRGATEASIANQIYQTAKHLETLCNATPEAPTSCPTNMVYTNEKGCQCPSGQYINTNLTTGSTNIGTCVNLPHTLSGLTLWLDPSQTSSITKTGNLISTINDLSGNNNHATDPTPASNTDKPTHTLNGKNYLGTITLDGNDALTGAITGFTNNNNFSLFIVGNFNQTAPTETAFAFGNDGNNNNTALRSKPTGFVIEQWQNQESTSANNTNWHVFSITRNPAALTLYVDGTAGTALASPPNQTNNTNYALGQHVQSTDLTPINGNIGEIILYNRTLTPNERQTIETYLQKKWGFLIP